MATPKVNAALTGSWADIAGSAASVAGLTWQNIGPDVAEIAFTTASPLATDAFNILAPGEAIYDKNGSAHVWARGAGPSGARLTGVAD